ncbi:MAG: hypothetical protein ACRDJF_00760 [Actinomycetota bacterium]
MRDSEPSSIDVGAIRARRRDLLALAGLIHSDTTGRQRRAGVGRKLPVSLGDDATESPLRADAIRTHERGKSQ